MNLMLTVGADPAKSRDVILEASPETVAGEVLFALARHLGLSWAADPGEIRGTCPRTGRSFGGAELIASVGLRQGDTVILRLQGEASANIEDQASPTEELVTLAVVGGPASGWRFRLGRGEHLVGREPGCELLLDDEEVSRRHAIVTVGAAGLTIRDLRSTNGTWLDGRRVSGDQAVHLGQVIKMGASTLALEPAKAVARSLSKGTDDRGRPAARLTVSAGSGQVQTELHAGVFVVGRGPECDIVIEDPLVSRRHAEVEVAEGGVSVRDLGSRNGTWVGGQRISGERAIDGERVRLGDSVLSFEAVRGRSEQLPASEDGTIPFNRPPRVLPASQARVLRLNAPPSVPGKAKLPMIASILPLVVALPLVFLTHPHQYAFLAFAILSPVMAVTSFLEDRRSGKRRYRQDAAAFREALAKLERDLKEAVAGEGMDRGVEAPGVPQLRDRALGHEATLWERRPGDPDFLRLRVGEATLPSHTSVEVETGGDPALRNEAERSIDRHRSIAGLPVTVDLAAVGAVGLAGPAEQTTALGRWFVLQAATLHSPKEVVLAAAVPADRRQEWEWLKWLPHTADEASPVTGSLLASDPAGARLLLDRIAALVASRSERLQARGSAERGPGPSLVLVVDDTVNIDRGPAHRILEHGPAVGVWAIWLGGNVRGLPGQCGVVIDITPGSGDASVVMARKGSRVAGVALDSISVEAASEMARAISPLRDLEVAAASAGIPSRISLLDLVELARPTPQAVDEAWRAAKPARLRAPVGATASGPFVVDLLHDGPHALVAGTTGSGKSELLQTLIASLGMTYPPTRLNFLLIDYKGGAAFKDCVELPHVVGLVTDLDGHLTRRALVSLEAELRHRERVIVGKAGAKDLREMERRQMEGTPPRLLIVIDEFATLAKEIPEFVEGVVDVSQRGRSLGLHLILATQSPAGVVTPKIRANTNLRIALRTTSEAESKDVIDVASAAGITGALPGRAFAIIGAGPVVEFQSAYVGTRTVAGDQPEVRVRAFELGGGAADAGRQHSETGLTSPEQQTDLTDIVTAIQGAARAATLPPQRTPWLPPLPDVVELESIDQIQPDTAPASSASIGLMDEPGLQRQRPFSIDFEREGSLLVYGTAGSGKTTLLRTLAAALARRHTPAELHIYGLDFSTKGLTSVGMLPHCGGVIPGEDEERVQQLFSELRRALEKRKEVFAQAGVSTLAEYRRALPAGEALPRIVVLLDGYAGFLTAFQPLGHGELVEGLPRLVSDGRSFGIHFVIMADRRGATPAALAGVVPGRIVLAMAEPDEFAGLGIKPSAFRGAQLPPGRGFVEDGLEVQIAVVGTDPSGSGQASAIASLGRELQAKHGDATVPRIEPLPKRVERAVLPVSGQPMHAFIGIGEEEMRPVAVDLSEGHFLVAGPLRRGRSSALGTIALSIMNGTPGLEMHLVAPRPSPLPRLEGWASASRESDQIDEVVGSLAERVQSRRRAVEQPDPLLLVVDDGTELPAIRGEALELVARSGRDFGVRIVAAVESHSAHRAYSGWLTEVRKDKQGLLLDPHIDIDGELLGTRLPRRTRLVFPPGRGFLVIRGAVELIQVAT